MKQRFFTSIKAALIIALVASLFAGCSSSPSVGSTYPLESITDNKGQSSRVYRAENKTVPEVAKELTEQNQPKEVSKEDKEHMFLIYPDEWYHLQQDPKKPTDTLIEVDNKEFVQQNYNPSFLQGFLLATVLDSLFDSHKSYPNGNYRGYGSRGTYKPIYDYHTPTKSEQKKYPPMTRQGSGSIIKRGNSSTNGSSVSGSDGKKDFNSPSSSGTGKIYRSSDSNSYSDSNSDSKQNGSFFSPRSNSPPKTKSGGSGSIFKRKSRR